GLGSIAGAVLGAVLVEALPRIIQEKAPAGDVLGFDIETGRIAVFGLLLIVVMIYRPGGLLAAKRRRTELAEAGAADAVVHDESAEALKTRGDTLYDAEKKG
ncbi:MAG TPA: hypothetical protein VHJ76_08520, partial [Actinomycetota bacterium]|nr:hypothetical protein [Actinomycetota bacterium]